MQAKMDAIWRRPCFAVSDLRPTGSADVRSKSAYNFERMNQAISLGGSLAVVDDLYDC